MILSPFLTFPCDCDKACRRVQFQLTQAGLRAVQTFDLQSARHTLSECPCPHHSTAECDCQMVVLLVYGKAGEPLTLILHGNQGATWVSFAEGTGERADARLMSAVRNILEELPAQIGNRT
jgi:hypothetical protein